jgi:hypothetical protein
MTDALGAKTSKVWTLTVADIGSTLLMPFDSNESPIAVDESGYGNNGTVIGAEWTSDCGGCYWFNATEKDYIVIPDSASLDGGGTWTQFMIEFWIKPTINNKGVRLIEKRSAGNSYQIGFQTTPSAGVAGNQLYWNVWTTVAYKEIVAPFGLPTGNWSHVVCTYNGTGMAIYVNATVAISALHSGTLTDSTCPVSIGRYGGGASSYFTGYLDDIRLYIQALPDQLIQQHYDETKGSYVKVNHSPEIDSYYPIGDPSIFEGQSQEFNVTYHDPDADPLAIQWYLNSVPTSTVDFYVFTAGYAESGVYNVTVAIFDGEFSVDHQWTMTVADVGPTLLMPFDSDESPVAVDKSDYGNNGTVNGAGWTSNYGGCYWFNATEKDYIVIPDSASLDGGGTWTQFMIEFWIKPTINNKGVRLIEKRSAGNSYQIGFQTTPSAGVAGNQLYWNVWTTVAYKEIVAPFGLPTGNWSHVVCTYNGTGMAIYVNATVAISALHSGTLTDSTCPVSIGRYGGGASSYFTGYLDDIRLYIQALPDQLIQQHYDETKGNHAGYTLTINVVGQGSVTKLPDQSVYSYGTSVQLTANAELGWSLGGWSGDLGGNENPSFIAMNSDRVVTALFNQIEYPLTVTASPSEGGSVSLNNSGPYHYGDKVELTANPETGWNFFGWIGSLSGSTSPEVITIDGEKSVTATFTQGLYSLIATVSPAEGGLISLNDTGPYNYGDWVELTANPAIGWSFDHWSEGLSGTVNPSAILIDDNKLVTAHFIQTEYSLTLTANPIEGGSVSTNASGPYHYGDYVELTAVPTVGWSFSIWSGDHSGSTNPAVITITDNTAVTATFTQDQYTLSVTTSGSGSVGKDPDQLTYTYGTVVTLTATPGTGYQFGQWSGDLSGSVNPTTITMTSDKSVTATFTTLLTDSTFDASVDNATLRANGSGQDWYESRGQNTTLLTLDTADVGGNSGKKARLTGGTIAATDNIYLTQEFLSAQTGVFTVQWDIYIDQILDISSPDRSGWMLIGDDLTLGSGPNAVNGERFVYMAFFKNGGGTSGSMDLVAVNRTGSFSSHMIVASGLSLKQWYTIRVVVNVTGGNYGVYVDGVFKATVTSRNAKTSLTHISFAQWNDGAGTFYVDNVFSPAIDTYKLTVGTDGHGSVTANPGESSYVFGTVVSLTPVADSGYVFDHWEISGLLVGSDDPYLVTMDSDKTVTAFFRVQP